MCILCLDMQILCLYALKLQSFPFWDKAWVYFGEDRLANLFASTVLELPLGYETLVSFVTNSQVHF